MIIPYRRQYLYGTSSKITVVTDGAAAMRLNAALGLCVFCALALQNSSASPLRVRRHNNVGLCRDLAHGRWQSDATLYAFGTCSRFWLCEITAEVRCGGFGPPCSGRPSGGRMRQRAPQRRQQAAPSPFGGGMFGLPFQMMGNMMGGVPLFGQMGKSLMNGFGGMANSMMGAPMNAMQQLLQGNPLGAGMSMLSAPMSMMQNAMQLPQQMLGGLLGGTGGLLGGLIPGMSGGGGGGNPLSAITGMAKNLPGIGGVADVFGSGLGDVAGEVIGTPMQMLQKAASGDILGAGLHAATAPLRMGGKIMQNVMGAPMKIMSGLFGGGRKKRGRKKKRGKGLGGLFGGLLG